MSRRGKSPGRRKATTELHNKANELDVAYPDDANGDSLWKWKSASWLLLSLHWHSVSAGATVTVVLKKRS